MSTESPLRSLQTGPAAAAASVPALDVATGASASAPPRRRLDSRHLFHDAREIDIAHAGSVYRLRITSLGKLILTK